MNFHDTGGTGSHDIRQCVQPGILFHRSGVKSRSHGSTEKVGKALDFRSQHCWRGQSQYGADFGCNDGIEDGPNNLVSASVDDFRYTGRYRYRSGGRCADREGSGVA